MTSLIFWLFWKILDLYYIPTKFHCCQTLNGRVNTGAFLPPPSNIGCAQTPSKIVTWVRLRNGGLGNSVFSSWYLFDLQVKIIFSYFLETENFQEPTLEVFFVRSGAFTYNFLPKIYMRQQFLSEMVLPFSFMFHARYSPCLLLW